jgi:quercetin dioxygenase-like cupin family protein
VEVVLLDSDEPNISLMPGDGLVVPKGVWHRVDIVEPSRIAYLTPGPNNEFSPLAADATDANPG